MARAEALLEGRRVATEGPEEARIDACDDTATLDGRVVGAANATARFFDGARGARVGLGTGTPSTWVLSGRRRACRGQEGSLFEHGLQPPLMHLDSRCGHDRFIRTRLDGLIGPVVGGARFGHAT